MHEYGLAEGVLATVRQRAGGRKVSGICVRFGVRHAVDEESLAQAEGLLGVRSFQEGNTGSQLQYWRSPEDLNRFAHQMPHMAWWKWLNTHRGQGFGFYHEVYQCKTAEAIFEMGTLPVGPATFCETSPVTSGEGRSVERQRRFAEAAAQSSTS